MKKLKPIFTGLLLGLALSLNAQQVINIQATFYSEALDEVRNVRVYLPGNYYSHPANLYYPVIYYLHGWTGDHNAVSEMLTMYQGLMAGGTIEPVIMVSADNWVEPFEGSFYTNSILWGNFEDYMTEDLINWVDATFRTIPHRKARAFIGQSMGGHGAFRLTLRHKDKFSAFAANGATVNFDLLTEVWIAKLREENPGPPYTFSYTGGGLFTRAGFLLSGAAAPNFNTPQTHINPAIVEYMFDENCELIDTVFQKIRMFDVIPLLHQTSVEDSIGIIFCCGTNDEWLLYEANAALADTLDALGLPYEFYSHTGGHGMPTLFKQRALIFLDFLLMAPVQVNVGIDELAGNKILQSYRVYPNPISHSTTINCELLDREMVRVSVSNYLGQEVATVYEGWLEPGWHTFKLDALSLPSGIYFCRFQTGRELAVEKIVKQ
ncbi:MAG: T9SS type A sorting domain-containing protein [Bacteroidales bacterium]|nr:T9SS type A sorting domain-containing protein [Bacteroidales bacterium]